MDRTWVPEDWELCTCAISHLDNIGSSTVCSGRSTVLEILYALCKGTVKQKTFLGSCTGTRKTFMLKRGTKPVLFCNFFDISLHLLVRPSLTQAQTLSALVQCCPIIRALESIWQGLQRPFAVIVMGGGFPWLQCPSWIHGCHFYLKNHKFG